MRILLPTMRDPGQIGGTSTHIDMLTRGLAEAGHEATALYLGEGIPELIRKGSLVWPAGALNRVRTGWGMVYAAQMRARWLAVRTAAECARAHGAGEPWDVLNAQEVYSVPYLRGVADEYGVPLVLTLHGYPLFESVSEGYSAASRMGLSYLMRAEMRALRLADAVVTVDGRLYRHALRLVPERAKSIHTLMNFIDTSAFAPPDDREDEERTRRDLRTHWGVPEESVVLFCPRRLVKKNGVVLPSLALAAMEPAQRERFLLLHAGEGGERQEMERIVRENGLEDQVKLLGGRGRDDILELYRLADIVLVPSVHSENVEEATSLSALEAMSSGRPLIAGDVGGLAEMVVDGSTGLLVSEAPAELAAAILRLAADPEMGARMAAAARSYVVEKHSHLRAAEAYADIYRQAVVAIDGDSSKDTRPPVQVHLRAEGSRTAGPAPSTWGSAPPAWTSVSVLGFTLDLVTLEQAAVWAVDTAVEAAALRETLSGSQRPAEAGATSGRTAIRTALALSFNPELIVRAYSDPAAAAALLEADLCYPDGVGAVWAAARQGGRLKDPGGGPSVPAQRVAGVDLAGRVLELAAERGLSVYFLGAAPGVAEEAARRQSELHPGLVVAGTHHGYFQGPDEAEVVEAVRSSGADIVLVAMGAPKQEVLLHRYRDSWGAGVALGVGGSFDVWAGTVKRAPATVQKAKVEWLYRLATDPRRAHRQLALPRYAGRVIGWSADDYGPPKRGRARKSSRDGSA